MTSSQWLDLAVLAVAFVAAISGWRSGALGSLLSFVGVVLGAVASRPMTAPLAGMRLVGDGGQTLTDDIAAASIATISRPFKICGTAVSMKIG